MGSPTSSAHLYHSPPWIKGTFKAGVCQHPMGSWRIQITEDFVSLHLEAISRADGTPIKLACQSHSDSVAGCCLRDPKKKHGTHLTPKGSAQQKSQTSEQQRH